MLTARASCSRVVSLSMHRPRSWAAACSPWARMAGVAFRARVVQMPPPPGRGGARWLAGRLASGVGARLDMSFAPVGAVLIRGLVRCPACGRGPVIRGGSMLSLHPQGGVIALEVCLAGHREGCAICMVTLWLRVAARGSRYRIRVGVTPAGLNEGIERVFVAVVPSGRRFPVGCGCPGFGLRVGSMWSLWWCLSGRGAP